MALWPFNLFTKQPVTNSAQPPGSLFVTGWQDGKPLFKWNDFAKQLESDVKWVHRCVNVITDSCSSVPYRLYVVEKKSSPVSRFHTRKIKGIEKDFLVSEKPQIALAVKKQGDAGELVEILDHPALDIFSNPNPHMTGSDLAALKWKSLLLMGNAYWLKVNNGLGVPQELWPLNTVQMSVVPSRTDFLQGYEYQVGVEKRTFEPSEIMHYKIPTPHDPFYGMSPLVAIVDTVTLMFYMDKFDVDLFYNKAVPQVVLSTDQTLNKDIVARVKAGWKDKFGFRGGKTGDISIIEAGLKVDQLTLSPQDLHNNEGQARILKEVFGVYGVPLTKADPSHIVSNTDATDRQYQRDTIKPLLIQDEQLRQIGILSDFDPALVGAYDSPVQEDKEFKLKESDTKVKNGTLTRNEDRATEGKEPLPPEQGDIVPPFNGGGPVSEEETEGLAKSIASYVKRKMYGEQ